MKKYYIISVKILLTIDLFTLLSMIVVGQPSFPATPDPAPIGGGMGLLALAGGAYAYKKLKPPRDE